VTHWESAPASSQPAEGDLTLRSVESIRKALTDFGYTGLTNEQIADGGRHLLAGGEPRDIIETFMRGMLRDAGLLEGDR
jgi:hypothetical protein